MCILKENVMAMSKTAINVKQINFFLSKFPFYSKLLALISFFLLIKCIS